MWNQSNWCERIIFFSSGMLILLLLYNAVFYISSSIWFVLYSLILIISSVWLTCYEIQFLLNQCEPLKTNSSSLLLKIVKLRYIKKFIPKIIPQYNHKSDLKTKKNDLSEDTTNAKNACIISSVIERKCIWAWYSNFVSKEIAFPFACKELFDQMVIKAFQIMVNIDAVSLSSDSIGIILRHLKEYKRSVKRLEKSNKSSIDECYRKFHPTSAQRNSNSTTNKGKSTQSHCLGIVKVFLKELLPWELWDTPHAVLLASILAKRLNSFMNNNLSDPNWLRYQIKQLLTQNNSDRSEILKGSPDLASNPALSQNTFISNENLDITPETKDLNIQEPVLPIVMKTSIESALSNMISNSTAPILQRAEIEETAPKSVLSIIPNINLEKKNSSTTQPINITGSVSNIYEFGNCSPSNNLKLKTTNDVKVYDKLIDGSLKTWNNDTDLECVSLGQDLLASLEGEIGFESRLGRLWEADAPETSEIWSPNAPSTGSSAKTSHALWFGEEDNLEMELTEESPPKNTDEAAGVMEGILDLGIAGFKKGLRLTGLQESLHESTKEKSTQNTPKPSSDQQSNNLVAAIGQVLSSSRKNSQTDETIIKLDHQKMSNKKEYLEEKVNTPQIVHLVKQHRVTSQDSENSMKFESLGINNIGIEETSLAIDPLIASGDSPDYEYEEVEDFASTIAKLRCLLQQKTSDIIPIPAEDVLATNINYDKDHQTLSDLNISPQKTIIQPNDKKPEELFSISSIESENGFTILDSSVDFIEAEEAINQKTFHSELPLPGNNIQRLDKLFTRTVTGVFNSIKTAVGGDTTSEILPGQDISNNTNEKNGIMTSISKDNWTFTKGNLDLSTLVSRLLIERRGYCIVEAAQDSLETIIGGSNCHQNTEGETSTIVQDDLDETEINKYPLWHMCIEVISVMLGGVMQKDVVIKCAGIAASEGVEKMLQDNLENLFCNLKGKVIDIFRNLYMASESTLYTDCYVDTQIEILCNEIMKKIPEFMFVLLGKKETSVAFNLLFSSIDHQLINRDLLFNLLDVFVLHFLKGSTVPSTGSFSTPPPSA